MPTFYDFAVVGDKRSLWGFSVRPQAIIINLGANDYRVNNAPTDDEFVSGYEALLTTIRKRNPDAFILCTVGPMLTGSVLSTVQANIETAVTLHNEAGDDRVEAYALQAANP